VFCGSKAGNRPGIEALAIELGAHLASEKVALVYGGAAKGLMGRIADAVLDAGGEVQGVIPQALMHKEIAHTGITRLHMVDTMHERKALMAKLSDGFVAMPGGFGTLEEIIEIVTWAQLRFHGKPCGLFNVDGYFDHLVAYLEHAEREGFLKPEHRRMLTVADEPRALIEAYERYSAPSTEKWL